MSAMTARTTQAEPSILWIIHKYLLRFTSCSYIWWNLKCKGINIYFLWSVELHHDLIAFSLSLFTRITYGSKLVEREQRGSEAQRPLDYVSVMTIADIHWVCSFISISHRENQRWYGVICFSIPHGFDWIAPRAISQRTKQLKACFKLPWQRSNTHSSISQWSFKYDFLGKEHYGVLTIHLHMSKTVLLLIFIHL